MFVKPVSEETKRVLEKIAGSAFIDLYFLLKKYSLEELLGLFERKFKDIRHNKLHILKSLTYFETAENEPMPKMLEKAEWKEIKEVISREANDFLKKQAE